MKSQLSKNYVIIRQHIMDRKPKDLLDLFEIEPDTTVLPIYPNCPWAAGVFEILPDGNLKCIAENWDTSDY